eukprot:141954_1
MASCLISFNQSTRHKSILSLLSSLHLKKFPTNSRTIYPLTTRSACYHSLKPTSHIINQTTTNALTCTHHIQSRSSSNSVKRKSTIYHKDSLNAWNLSHGTRNMLHLFGYWSPRIVIMAWFGSVIAAGLYLLKKSIDTDGFSTSFSPGTGGDINQEHWTMISHNGEKFTRDDTLGKYLLIYFGFTFCPDVCPVEMQKLADIADILKERGVGLEVVQPVFVSVDYRRDTPKMIQNYIHQYTHGDDEKILGLCGTREQMEHFARVMKTYFSDPPQLEEDYVLEHSTYMYFTGTDGSFKHLTNTEDGPEVLANKVALWIAEDKGRTAKVVEQVKQVFR